MTKKISKDELTSTQKVSIGLGLTAAAVTAAGAYFLYGSKHANQNRKKVKGWALKAKGEVLETLEKTKSITAEEYHELVNAACNAYGTIKNATAGEVKDFKKEMLEHWSDLQNNKALKKIVSGTKTTAQKKVVKKAVAKKMASVKAVVKTVAKKR